MPLRLSTLSTEYVRTPIVGTTDQGAPIDPTPLDVEMAIVRLGLTPQNSDWKTATWVTVTAPDTSVTYWSRLLVGPDVYFPLTPAAYWVWVKIFDNAETPVKRSGLLVIF